MAAKRFDPEEIGPSRLRMTGWAWYEVGTLLILVGTDAADQASRPSLADGSPPPFWRVSELARTVENGSPDPWMEAMARELMSAILADLAADPF
jgi:hypothetical protein